MRQRTLSPHQMFVDMAAAHVPEFHFPRFGSDFAAWKRKTLPKVLETLGTWPSPAEPHAELVTEWTDRGIRKRKFLIEVGPHASATVQVNTRPEISTPTPTILCWHGHGPYGKEPVVGNVTSEEIRKNIAEHNYDYGHQMAEAGFVTYAIDWMNGGERSDRERLSTIAQGRDWCNLYYLNATMLGFTSLSLNLGHGRAATDFVTTLPEVDASRLGVMGLSGGGTMTVWTALTDDRFKAAEVICYSHLWAQFGIHDLNYCGMQVAPGLFRLVDLPDLQGLIAPRPLLVDIGLEDTCFSPEGALACFEQLKGIYAAARASEFLELDCFPGGHAWGGRRSAPFFQKYL